MFALTPRPVNIPADNSPVPPAATRNTLRVPPRRDGATLRGCGVFPVGRCGNRAWSWGARCVILGICAVAVSAFGGLTAFGAPDRPFGANANPNSANFGLGPVGGPVGGTGGGPVGGPGAVPAGTPLLGRPLDRLPLNPLPHPAVVRVVAQERNAESHGSGTLIDVREDCGLVVTNWHVVRDAVGKIEVRFPGGFVSPARVRKADKVWDLAALVIWRPPVDPVRISRQPPRRGEPLTIAGYGPGPYRAVAGRCTQYVSPGVNYPPEMVELSAEARQGDSGGPIFNDQGELAGVLFGAARGTTTGSYGGRVREFLASIVTDPGAFPNVAGAALAGLPANGNGNGNGSGTGNGQPVSSPPPFSPQNFAPPNPAPANFNSPIDGNSTAANPLVQSPAAGPPAATSAGPWGGSPIAPAVALGQPLSENTSPSPSNMTPLAIPDPASHPLQLPPPPDEAVARASADLSTGSNASISRTPSALPVLPMPPPPRNAAGMPLDGENDDRATWAASPFKLRESPGTAMTAPSASQTPQTLEQWLALDGAPAEQAKTVLAVVGALALLSQAGRLFQPSEPAPRPKS